MAFDTQIKDYEPKKEIINDIFNLDVSYPEELNFKCCYFYVMGINEKTNEKEFTPFFIMGDKALITQINFKNLSNSPSDLNLLRGFCETIEEIKVGLISKSMKTTIKLLYYSNICA